MKYKYIAMDSNGSEKDGSIDADNQSVAISKIRAMGYFPTRVMPVDDTPRPSRQKSPLDNMELYRLRKAMVVATAIGLTLLFVFSFGFIVGRLTAKPKTITVEKVIHIPMAGPETESNENSGW
tara:strand:+ start:344 stop:712 length:369 start_codon:yes stop_codon:yes gene_type:complete